MAIYPKTFYSILPVKIIKYFAYIILSNFSLNLRIKSVFRRFFQFHCPISAKKFGENTLVVYQDAVSCPSLREIFNDIVNNVSQHWKFIHVHKINHSHFQQCHPEPAPVLSLCRQSLIQSSQSRFNIICYSKVLKTRRYCSSLQGYGRASWRLDFNIRFAFPGATDPKWDSIRL